MKKVFLLMTASAALWAQSPVKTEPPKAPVKVEAKPKTVEELQKEVDELRSQVDKANKLLQAYYQKWTGCDAQLTQLQLQVAPKDKE